MPKQDKIYPNNVVGGRIQARRQELNIKREELYDLVFDKENDDNLDEEQKKKIRDNKIHTVQWWESGRQNPPLERFRRICKVLHCSADFLFGEIDYPTHDIEYICEKTGMPESFAELLVTHHSRVSSSFPSEMFQDKNRLCNHDLVLLEAIYRSKDFIEAIERFRSNYDVCEVHLPCNFDPSDNSIQTCSDSFRLYVEDGEIYKSYSIHSNQISYNGIPADNAVLKHAYLEQMGYAANNLDINKDDTVSYYSMYK